jgi:hypothetical protein
MIVLSLSVLVCIAAVGVWSGRGPQQHELLREVYSPTFEHVPPFGTIGDALVQLRQDVSSRTSQTAWPLSSQTIVLLIAVIVTGRNCLRLLTGHAAHGTWTSSSSWP